MGYVFIGLSKLKVLRGTVLDPFGWQQDRKLERELIAWFEDVLNKVACGSIACADAKTALCAPMDIRGFGPVKETSAQEANSMIASLNR